MGIDVVVVGTSNTTASASTTTGSFTPPAGSYLLVAGAGGSSGSNAMTLAVSDSQTATWNSLTLANLTAPGGGGGGGCTQMFWRRITTSASMTVTMTISGTASNSVGLQVWRLMGSADLTFGTSVRGTATGGTLNITPTAFTSTVSGSQMFVSVSEWSGGATISSSDLTLSVFSDANQEGGSGRKQLGAAGVSQTFNLSIGAGGGLWYWTAVEVSDQSIAATPRRPVRGAALYRRAQRASLSLPLPPSAAGVTGRTVTSRARQVPRATASRRAIPPPPMVTPSSPRSVVHDSRLLPRAALRRSSMSTPISPPALPPPYPPSTRGTHRWSLSAALRRGKAFPLYLQQFNPPYPTSTRGTRRWSLSAALRRGKAFPLNLPQINPPYPTSVRGTHRWSLTAALRRGKAFEAPKPQTVTPTVFITPTLLKSRQARVAGWPGVGLRRGHAFEAPKPQTVSPVFKPPDGSHWHPRPPLARRGRLVTPTPGQQPATTPAVVRRRATMLPTRRGAMRAPPFEQAVAPPTKNSRARVTPRHTARLRPFVPVPLIPAALIRATARRVMLLRRPARPVASPSITAGGGQLPQRRLRLPTPPLLFRRGRDGAHPPWMGKPPVWIDSTRAPRPAWRLLGFLRRGRRGFPVPGGLAPIRDIRFVFDEATSAWVFTEEVTPWAFDEASSTWIFTELNGG